MKTNVYAGLATLVATALLAGVAGAQTATPAANAQAAPAGRFARLDTDGDRRISQAEFVQARTARLTVLDADRDGSVAPAEIRARMQAARAGRVETRFAALDADKDGQISRAEFAAARPQRADAARPGRGDRGYRMARHAGRGPDRGQARRARLMARPPVVIAEVQARAAAAFARLDADKDGFLTVAEARAGRGEHRRGRMGHRMHGRTAPAATPSSPAPPASE
jgi:hypothetical protein